VRRSPAAQGHSCERSAFKSFAYWAVTLASGAVFGAIWWVLTPPPLLMIGLFIGGLNLALYVGTGAFRLAFSKRVPRKSDIGDEARSDDRPLG
jgi:hypothetical protein